MNVVFMGSDEIACELLGKLLRAGEFAVRAIVTQPDRPCGRRLRLSPTPVRSMVLDRSLPIDVFTPAKVNTPAALDAIAAYQPDVIVVVAYGQILGERLLTLPPLGCINFHFSILPELRGAAPITRAILEGFTETGVTAMRMDAGMDSGDILAMRQTAISEDDTCVSLSAKLTKIASDLAVDTLRSLAAGEAIATPQNHTLATYAPKIEKDEWLIDWTWPAEQVCRAVRAFFPKPGCTTFLPPEPTKGDLMPPQLGSLLKILAAAVEGETSVDALPGTVVSMKGGLLVAAGDGKCVRLLEVRPEGRPRALSGVDFANGYRQRVQVGQRLFPGLSAAAEECPCT